GWELGSNEMLGTPRDADGVADRTAHGPGRLYLSFRQRWLVLSEHRSHLASPFDIGSDLPMSPTRRLSVRFPWIGRPPLAAERRVRRRARRKGDRRPVRRHLLGLG